MQALKLAARTILRNPGFAFAAILSLALAIAANTIVFGALNALILRPLPVNDPERLFFLQRGQSVSHAFPLYRTLGEQATLSSLGAYRIAPLSLQMEGGSQRIWGYLVTGNYFDLLGVQPAAGRFFHAEDDMVPDSAPFAVLSYSSWHARFGGDPEIAGRIIRIKNRSYTILGVAPEGFRGTELFYVPEIWVPMMMQPHIEDRPWLDNWGTQNSSILVRVRDGVTRQQAEENLSAIGAVVAREHGWTQAPRFVLVAPGLVGEALRAPVRSFSLALLSLAGLVLLTACLNLATLFIVRSVDRFREMGIKLALGAGRNRLSRELMLEVLLLCTAGGIAGLVLAEIALRFLTSWRIPVALPVQFDLHGDIHVVAFAIVAAIVAGLMASLGPVWSVWHIDPSVSFRPFPSGAAAFRRRVFGRLAIRDVLLAVQMACCCVLVTGGIVSLRGLAGALGTHVAMDLDEVTVTGFDLGSAGYDIEAGREFQRRAFEVVKGIPGVASAAYGNSIPLYIDQSTTSIFTDSAVTASDPSSRQASYYYVSPAYFRTLGTRLVSGRDFSSQDDRGAPQVAIVNETLARRVGLVGRTGWRLRRGCATCPPIEVVGIAENGRYQTLTEADRPAVFFPILQSSELTTMVMVRSSRPQGQIAAEIRERLRQLDTDLPLYSIGGLAEAIAFVFVPAWAAITLNGFSLLAAMLVVTGVYGLSAYTVSKRAREISIRAAIGARPRQIIQGVLGRTGLVVVSGSAIGMALGLSASQVLSSVVYQATPFDPIALFGAIAAMGVIALAAIWVPARRALKIDPVRALRDE